MDLEPKEGELHFTMHIIRAATGVTETHEMVGHVVPAPETKPEGVDHGTDA